MRIDERIDNAARIAGFNPDTISAKQRSGLRHLLETLDEAEQKLPPERVEELRDWAENAMNVLNQRRIEVQKCVDCGKPVRRPGTYRCQGCFDNAIRE